MDPGSGGAWDCGDIGGFGPFWGFGRSGLLPAVGLGAAVLETLGGHRFAGTHRPSALVVAGVAGLVDGGPGRGVGLGGGGVIHGPGWCSADTGVAAADDQLAGVCLGRQHGPHCRNQSGILSGAALQCAGRSVFAERTAAPGAVDRPGSGGGWGGFHGGPSGSGALDHAGLGGELERLQCFAQAVGPRGHSGLGGGNRAAGSGGAGVLGVEARRGLRGPESCGYSDSCAHPEFRGDHGHPAAIVRSRGPTHPPLHLGRDAICGSDTSVGPWGLGVP